MRRTIPSTTALVAFESAARHQSFTRAAADLAVTQSAVCRQVAGLESLLGVKLFRRTPRGIALTEAGRGYHVQVALRLGELERDTVAVMSGGTGGAALELGVVPTFGTRWLLPRLAGFQRAHPGIQVHLTPRTRPFLFDESGLDAAIHAGESAWPGTAADFLMRETLVAVASPARAAAVRGVGAAAWRRQVLLQQTTRPLAWRRWFASLGIEVENDRVGPRCELFSMLTEAAIQGLGVALIPRFLIEAELRDGVLVEVLRHDHLSERSYRLIYPAGGAEAPALVAFRAWLLAEAAAYREAAGLA